MTNDLSTPLRIDVKSAQQGGAKTSLNLFDSYSFDRNLLVPASPFRFTAPGVDKAQRLAIRSGDLVELFVQTPRGSQRKVATGFIDETDAHVTSTTIEYLLTGRDTLGQLIDNSAIDKSNQIIHLAQISIEGIARQLVANTRVPQVVITQQVPNGLLLFQTNPGETKISALQRYLEYTNCQVWTNAEGQVVIGKPNFTQPRSGKLILSRSDPSANNVLDARVRRNVNTAIRQIATQIQSLSITDPASVTLNNNDPDLRKVSAQGVGRSLYRVFGLGNGQDSINTVTQIGTSGDPSNIGHALSLREIARSNMQILDVELVIRGHVNDNDLPYSIDQVYNVQIEDDDVDEDLYVYSCRYDLTLAHGRLTTLRLCRLGTIVAYVDALPRRTIGGG